MNIFELSALITADTSDFDSKVGNMVSSGIKKFAALTAAAGAAVTTFATTKAVKVGAEFDKAMSQVQATMLKTNEEMTKSVGTSSSAYGEFTGNLREFALFLGENTVFSATQAAEALNYMALAGYDTQQSMDMLPNVLSLAAAGNFDLARASDMVTDAQTAFGISAERTTQMVDEMAKTASISNTSVEQMGDAFLVVGGLAKELNGGMVELADGTMAPVDGLQELEIALGAMANAGIKGSEAGTHMRNMLLKLSSPTAEGTKQLEALGVQVFDSEGKMRSLNDIFGDLNVSMSNLTQEEKLQAISDLFNTRDTASAEALLAAVGQDWDDIGAGILDASGAAGEMSKIQLDNLSGDVTLMKSAMEGLQVAIADEVSPSLRKFVQKGTKWIQGLAKSVREGKLHELFEKVRVALDKLGQAISPLVEKFKELFSSEEAGEKATSILSTIFDAFVSVISVASNILATIVGWLAQFFGWLTSGSDSADVFIAVVTGIATALGVLLAIVKGYLIIQQIVQGFQMLSGVFTFLAANPIVLIIAAIAGLVLALITLYNNNEEFRAKVQAIWEAISGFFSTAAEVIKQVWEEVVQFFTTAWQTISEVWSVVVEFFSGIWAGIQEVFAPIANWFSEKFEEAWRNIKIAWAFVTSFFSTIWAGIQGVFRPIIEWFRGKFEDAWEAIKKVFEPVIEFFQGIWEDITGAFDGIGEEISGFFDMDWFSVGHDIITGIADGVSYAGQWLWDAIWGAVSSAWDNLLGWLGIASPSKKARDKIGKMWSKGIGIGFVEGMPTDDMVGAVEDAFDEVGNVDPVSFGVDDYDVSSFDTGSPASRDASGNGIEINIYATERQDPEEIAREVQRVLIQWENQRKAAYA